MGCRKLVLRIETNFLNSFHFTLISRSANSDFTLTRDNKLVGTRWQYLTCSTRKPTRKKRIWNPCQPTTNPIYCESGRKKTTVPGEPPWRTSRLESVMLFQTSPTCILTYTNKPSGGQNGINLKIKERSARAPTLWNQWINDQPWGGENKENRTMVKRLSPTNLFNLARLSQSQMKKEVNIAKSFLFLSILDKVTHLSGKQSPFRSK